MDYIMNNWFLLIAAIAVTCMCIFVVVDFKRKPRAEQIADVKEWLLWAVNRAEEELGSGTGPMKLRMCYDMFVSKFPWVAKVVSFDTFAGWVDESLEALEKYLAEKGESA